jgi:alkylhydroperoxidase family enzyme
MPLLPPVTDDQASDAAQTTFQGLRAKHGTVINIYRTLAHAPEVLEVSLQFSLATQAALDLKLRELAYLKTSQLNQCDY